MPNRIIQDLGDRRLVETEAGDRFWEHAVHPMAFQGPGEVYEQQRRMLEGVQVRDQQIRQLLLRPAPPMWFSQEGAVANLVEMLEKAEVPEEDKALKLANDFLIGCDPEFAVLNNGAPLNVKAMIQNVGTVGWDHDGTVVELRPKPAKSAFTLLKHLKDSLNYLKPLQPYQYRAGAYLEFPVKKISLGGHVHFDLPFMEKELESRRRLLALDELTESFESLDILTKSECALRRSYGEHVNMLGNQTNYGAFGDARADKNRMEYRTMASWLYSPITSFLCLTAAKLAAVAPKEVLRMNHSKEGVTNFFEVFAEKDVDAKRVMEKLVEPGLKLQRDPTVDFKTVWKEEFKLLEAA